MNEVGRRAMPQTPTPATIRATITIAPLWRAMAPISRV